MTTVCSRRGFVLGLVLIVSLIMAIFIFSYNSVVRSGNLKAHHEMIAQTADHLAISGASMLSSRMAELEQAALQSALPDLLKPTNTIPATVEVTSGIVSRIKTDYQNFLNQAIELSSPGLLGSVFPQVVEMKIVFDKIRAINPGSDSGQFQAGRDPVEKVGELLINCIIEYQGLRRKAEIRRQFRVVSMVPGPYCRFSFFTSTTPNPHSYNAVGTYFDGSIHAPYSHTPTGNSFSGVLKIYNGTDSEDVTSTSPEKDLDTDRAHLRNRGWIFIGPSPQSPGQALNLREGPVFFKIPSGFNQDTGGEFMIGWPSSPSSAVLLPELIENPTHFAPDTSFAPHDYMIGATFRGFYVAEDGNPWGAGGRNLWPALTSGGGAFTPDDHFLSASTWLFPFGTTGKASRTLVVGPALAGFLKFFFIRGLNSSTAESYRGIFASMQQSDFDSKIASNKPLFSFAGTGLWAGNLTPTIYGEDFFLNGYNSFIRLMPFNSLPTQIDPLNGGVAFNLLFDFMKYSRTSYPQLDAAPTLASTDYAGREILVPGRVELNNGPVKGLHPFNNMQIYFKENGQYNPTMYADNCYFAGDLRSLRIGSSNLVQGRVTHILDMNAFTTLDEENQRVEKYLFKKSTYAGADVNVPKRSGIFYIRRRNGATSNDTDALRLSTLPILINKPLIILVDKGSVEFDRNILCDMVDGAPGYRMSLCLIDGDFFINAGSGETRRIDAYLAALSGVPGRGRLLNKGAGNASFQINGGLAVTEAGLHLSSAGRSTMRDFPGGGEINYNPAFNPSLPSYATSHILVLEDNASQIVVGGGG